MRRSQIGLSAAASIIAGVSAAHAATAEVTCKADQVGVFASRIFVRCNTGAPIFTFAYPTRDAAQAARVLNILTTVMLGGPEATVTIVHDPADTSGVAIGCPSDNCRLILGVRYKD
jgi:hypothetical protein